MAAISVAIVMVTAVLPANAQSPPTSVTVNTVSLVVPVALHVPVWVLDVMLTVNAVFWIVNTLASAVTVNVSAAAKLPVALVVAPNVINVGVADVRRSLARKLALVIWSRTNV